MQRNVIGLKFTVGVEEQAAQVVPELRFSALERAQEEAPGVVVVGVQVVPDERGTLEDGLHLSQIV